MSRAAAVSRFKNFHERAPKEGEIIRVKMDGAADAFVVGEMPYVIYKSAGDGEQYIHRFKKNARPVLAVSSDGKQAYVLAGAYEFTERGFEDKAPKRASRPANRRKK